MGRTHLIFRFSPSPAAAGCSLARWPKLQRRLKPDGHVYPRKAARPIAVKLVVASIRAQARRSGGGGMAREISQIAPKVSDHINR